MLSIFAWFGYRELAHEESLRLIKRAGFEGVLLWWEDAFDCPQYRQLPAFARRIGLFVENIHAPFEDTNHIWEDTADGQAAFECYLQIVEDCAQFEIPAMVMHATYGREYPPASTIGLDRFKRIADLAEHKGVNVAIENMRVPEAIARAALVLEQIDSPRLGFCFDSGHYNARFVQTPGTDMLARFGHRLMALHLHDNKGFITGAGEEDQHLPPFDGNIDWTAQMRAIAATGYRGPTTLEVCNDGHQDLPPEEFLALAYERAVRLEQLRNT